MLFNSLEFGIFLPIVFTLYWFVFQKNLKLQNVFLIVASYVFYAWWDWRFLSLIMISSVLDWYVGLRIYKEGNKKRRKAWLWFSIVVDLGILGFFKYYNFFIENFIVAFRFFGSEINPGLLNIILPVGISFYTFQALSYSIDIYRGNLKPSDSLIPVAAYVAFFPQLMAGPIERATNLLPQFYKKRKFDYSQAVDGMRQMLWGLFKKVVIADTAAEYANLIFNNSSDYSGSTLILGALFFTFQIYGDFSGYSDMAIGMARLFGFKFKRNFAFPYFSRDIAEFWRRWHISLSSWFRDYLYIPLGGSRGGLWMKIRNTFIIFLVSGFWHGANWTFVVWGGLNALYFLPLMLLKKNRENLGVVAQDKIFPTFGEVKSMFITFVLTVVAWIFFRAENITHAFSIYNKIFSQSIFNNPFAELDGKFRIILIGFIIAVFMVFEWFGRGNEYAIEKYIASWNQYIRHCFYLVLTFMIFWFSGGQQEFIYFQF